MSNNPNLPNIIIMGHGAHGKDTVCELIADTYSCISSSRAACEQAVYPVLGPKYGYATEQECYDDRRNHRQEWKDLISTYNEQDPTRLAREIFKHHNVYNGIRSAREFHAVMDAGIVDTVVWIDASHRLPDSIDTTMDLTERDADIIIDNNGTLAQLEPQISTALKSASYFSRVPPRGGGGCG